MTRQLRAGAAAVSITPPIGVSMVGSYSDRRAESILSDLFARAVVLDDGSTEVAVVVLDLCYIGREVALRVRTRVESLTGIPAERVMLTCTHTHYGPATTPTAWYDPDACYVDVLVRRIGDAVALAHQSRREARLLLGRGEERSIAFNRRFWMADGTLRTNPGYQNPDIVRSAGPIDPEVGVVRLEDTTGKPVAMLVNYALHADTASVKAISADHPGALCDFLQKLEGPDLVVLFVLGCCGDINHIDVSKPGPQSGPWASQRIGTVLAGEVVKVGARLMPATDASRLTFGHKVVDLPLHVPTPEDVSWARERSQAAMRGMGPSGLEVVKAHRILWIERSGLSSIPGEVQVMTVGDLAYVTLPGEVFVELGLEIKRRSPFAHTLIGELNGTIHNQYMYVPTEKAYAEGGYEATNSPFQPGSGEMLVEAAVELLEAARG